MICEPSAADFRVESVELAGLVEHYRHDELGCLFLKSGLENKPCNEDPLGLGHLGGLTSDSVDRIATDQHVGEGKDEVVAVAADCYGVEPERQEAVHNLSFAKRLPAPGDYTGCLKHRSAA